MRLIKGQVISFDEDGPSDGVFYAQFPTLKKDVVFPVVYTSPYYNNNAGGMVALPSEGSHILAVYNEDAEDEEHLIYYQSTIVAEPVLNNYDKEALKHANEHFEALRDNDSKAKTYGRRGKPVTQSFTNAAGAGLYIQREYANPQISDNVTIKQQTGSEVTVGSLGVQVKNDQGDFISLHSMGKDYKGSDSMAARSLSIQTEGSQEIKCKSSDINIRVMNGGDINIENNSSGDKSFGSLEPGNENAAPGESKWSGNIRLKSRYRNIDLAALGDNSNIHIITNKAKIKVNGVTGEVQILSDNTITLNSNSNIDLNASDNINLNAGGSIFLNPQGNTSINGSVVSLNGLGITTMNPTGGDVSVKPIPANQSPQGPTLATLEPNDYNDGLPGEGAV